MSYMHFKSGYWVTRVNIHGGGEIIVENVGYVQGAGN